MSDQGGGTPPPPPPYGSPSPSGDPYGQQPAYGSPAPDPYGQPPGYGAPQQPGYGQPQQPGYGQPQQPAYGAPQQPGYGQPQQPGYGAPPPAYGAPPYGAPAQPYGYPPAPYGGMPMAPPGNLATMGKRAGARIVDSLITSVIVYGLGFALIGGAISTIQTDPATGQVTSGGGTLLGALFTWVLIAFVFGVLYEFVMIALKGATLGKMALGIKVVREVDGQVPGWGPSAIRYGIAVLGSLACGIGAWVVYLSPFWDNAGRLQGYHDKAAHTLVVNR